MTDAFEFTFDHPLTEEQWDMITDVDFDRTDRIWFHTKHGKEVEFAKVTRCKDCKYWQYESCFVDSEEGDAESIILDRFAFDFCSRAERKEE